MRTFARSSAAWGKQNEAFGITKALLFDDDLPQTEQPLFKIDSAQQGKEGLAIGRTDR